MKQDARLYVLQDWIGFNSGQIIPPLIKYDQQRRNHGTKALVVRWYSR
jgi:hypothetical protein